MLVRLWTSESAEELPVRTGYVSIQSCKFLHYVAQLSLPAEKYGRQFWWSCRQQETWELKDGVVPRIVMFAPWYMRRYDTVSWSCIIGQRVSTGTLCTLVFWMSWMFRITLISISYIFEYSCLSVTEKIMLVSSVAYFSALKMEATCISLNVCWHSSDYMALYSGRQKIFKNIMSLIYLHFIARKYFNCYSTLKFVNAPLGVREKKRAFA
jgi:hypothetical protein